MKTFYIFLLILIFSHETLTFSTMRPTEIRCFIDGDEVNLEHRHVSDLSQVKRSVILLNEVEPIPSQETITPSPIESKLIVKHGTKTKRNPKKYREVAPVQTNIGLSAVAAIGLITLVLTGFGYAYVSLFRPYPIQRQDLQDLKSTEVPFSIGGSLGGSMTQTFSNVLKAMDAGLSKYNIDGTSCMQRFICGRYKASIKKPDHDDSQLNLFLYAMTESDLTKKFISGTVVGDAIEVVRSGKDCSEVFNRCLLSWPTMQRMFNVVAGG